MKKSKILAFLTAFSMIASIFSAFSISASAAASPNNDGLTFVAEYAGLDEDGYHLFNFTLEDTQSKLAKVDGSKKYTGNIINKIQYVIDFDENIFDISELYIDYNTDITSLGGLFTKSADYATPVKFAWLTTDYKASVYELPEYIVQVAVMTNDEYSEEEMLAGITFDGLTNYQVCYFDGTSKEPTYTSIYYTAVQTGSDEISAYLAPTRYGKEKEETKDPTVANLELDKTSVDLDLNGTTSATVKATVTMDPADAEAAEVEWTSNNTDVATVEDGVITAKAVGDATITAKAGEKSVDVAVKVVDTTPVVPDKELTKEGEKLPDTITVAGAAEGNVLTYVKKVESGVSATKHAKITNKTQGEFTITAKNIAELLGGEAEEGATIEGAIVVIVSGPEGDEFEFDIVD
jgi:hypothetical protein